MQRGVTHKLAAIMLIMAMMLAACSSGVGNGNDSVKKEGNREPSDDASDEVKEEVIIRVLVPETGTRWNMFPDNAVAQEIKKKTGITVEFVESDENKFKVLLAGGDLPDIVRADPAKYGKQLIEGGLVIPMDELLQVNGQDIANNISTTLDFSRQNWSQGQNKLYFLPAQIQAKPVSYLPDIGMGALIRWEFYEEIGAPEISSPDDLLNALKQIVDKHPTTEDGKKMYGVSFWSDWGLWQYVFPMFWYKGERTDNSDFMVKQVGAKQYTNMLTDENSTYWEALQYYYKARQMGLLDPDALTMKSDDYSAKMTAGQYVSGIVTWALGEFNNNNAKDGKGFVTIPNTTGFSFSGGVSPAGWVDKTYAITKSSKNPEKAMELLNYLYSYDGARTMHSGVEGVHWMMKDGKPQLTEEAIKIKFEGGDELYKTGIGLDANFIGLGEMVTHPGDGMQLNLYNTPEVYQLGMTELNKVFSHYYNVPYPGKIWEERLEAGQLIDANTVLKGLSDEEILAENMIALPIVPDDMKKLEVRLKDLGAKYAASVILSKDNAEFEENKEKAIAAFKDAGADQYTDWYTKAYAEARVAAGAK